MSNEDVLKERERIKAIIERKIDDVIEYRDKRIKREKRKLLYAFKDLKSNILFTIDNPDYVRKTINP